MTPEQHYTKAEEWAARADEEWFSDEKEATWASVAAQLAQVHATLATITTPPLGARR